MQQNSQSSEVTLRLPLWKTGPELCVIYDDETKDYEVKITQANFYVQKKTMTEKVYTAIETTLTKISATHRYTEIIERTVPSQLGVVAGIMKILLTVNLFVGVH